MKGRELKPGMRVWCWWMSRYLIYIGKAYNGRDYEFEDFGDCLIVLGEAEVSGLRREK